MSKKTYSVTVTASCTVNFSRLVEAESEEAARTKMRNFFMAIDSGMVSTSGEVNTRMFKDVSFEILEGPKAGHDFFLEDIQVEEEKEESPCPECDGNGDESYMGEPCNMCGGTGRI